MRRSQVKMFETLAVLVVFFFFLIFGASFYFKLQENALVRELDRNTQLRAVQIAQKSRTLPELDCSYAGVQREHCVDVVKVRAFQQFLTDADTRFYYEENIFGKATLTVNQVYPAPSSWLLYDRPGKTEQSTAVQLPILLYDPVPNEYRFGYLEVRVYE